MNVGVRSETPADYTAIAEVNLSAFHEDKFVDEMVLVDALRHMPGFDPELSLVAEVDGQIVGHAMFTTYDVLIGGAELRATNLAPLAVLKEYQKRGIGAALMLEGHRRAKEKGYAFDFLWGHPGYYPRFGYVGRMFGDCSITVEKSDLPKFEGEATERQVTAEDVPFLLEMWNRYFADAPFTIKPTGSLVSWTSHGENARTSMIITDGEVSGYVRYRTDKAHFPAMLLAKDSEGVAAGLALLAGKSDAPALKLPLDPASKAVVERIRFPYKPQHIPWDACMIKVLDESAGPINVYVDRVSKDSNAIGIPILPSLFDALP